MDAVVVSGVQEAIAELYVRWAQRFAISIKGKPLRARFSEDVRRVLRDLKCQEGIEPWQTKQAREALTFLYRDFLKLDRPSNSTNLSINTLYYSRPS